MSPMSVATRHLLDGWEPEASDALVSDLLGDPVHPELAQVVPEEGSRDREPARRVGHVPRLRAQRRLDGRSQLLGIALVDDRELGSDRTCRSHRTFHTASGSTLSASDFGGRVTRETRVWRARPAAISAAASCPAESLSVNTTTSRNVASFARCMGRTPEPPSVAMAAGYDCANRTRSTASDLKPPSVTTAVVRSQGGVQCSSPNITSRFARSDSWGVR